MALIDLVQGIGKMSALCLVTFGHMHGRDPVSIWILNTGTN